MKSLESIASDALLLPTAQRLNLAQQILASIDTESDPLAQTAWDQEIRERIRRYDAGEISTISGAEVFEALDKKLAR